MAVRTGTDSRTELTFTDETLARVGANSIFTFTAGTRSMELKDGAMLLRVPKNSGGAKINTAAVTAAITGTTVMLEFHPKSYVKFIVLEGTGRVYLPGHLGESVLVNAGQMLITKANAKALPAPVNVDVRKLMRTSKLVTGFRKLASAGLIADVESKQDKERASGALVETNLAIFGSGTDILLVDPVHLQESPTPAPTVAPTPVPVNEFGPPKTISTPDPYPLGPGSAIHTGPPSIVTSGVPDYGTIFRNSETDGSRAQWFFGSIRPFDVATNFDGPGIDLNNIATFKFGNLVLTGDPVITVENGGPTKLALVGVNGISAGGLGGPTTFAGLDTLLLATENGSIQLGENISFQNIPRLIFYARGDNANLSLSSPMSGIKGLELDAEGSIVTNSNIGADRFQAFSGADYLGGNGIINARMIEITAGRDLTFAAAQFPDLAGGGGSIQLNASGTLTWLPGSGGSSRDSIVATAGTINFATTEPTTFDASNPVSLSAGNGGVSASSITFTGGALTITSGGPVSIGGATLNLDGAGKIEAGGSITSQGLLQAPTVIAGGGIKAPSLSAHNVSAGGDIALTENLTLDSGLLTAGGNLNVGNVVQLLGPATRLEIGGNLTTKGGIFSSSPDTSLVVTGNLTAPNLVVGSVTVGGELVIGANNDDSFAAVIARSIVADSLVLNSLTIRPFYSRSVNGKGVTPFDLSITANQIRSSSRVPSIFADGSSASASILPGNGGNVTIDIREDGLNISPTGDLLSVSANGGGDFFGQQTSEGGNGGSISVSTAGALNVSAPIEATSGLTVSPSVVRGKGGSVALASQGDSVNVNSRVQVSSADQQSGTGRRSRSGGSVALKSGRPSGVAINLSNTSQLLALLDAAAPGPGGKITILATGSNSRIDANGRIQADRGVVDLRHTGDNGTLNLGTSTGSAMEIHGDTVKAAVLGSNGTLNIGAGNISADSTLQLYAPGSNGTINFVANVNLSGAGAKTIAGNTVNIFNGVVVNVGGSNAANVFTNHANYTGFGGNGTLTGTFSGAGANAPRPLDQAPPIGPPPGG